MKTVKKVAVLLIPFLLFAVLLVPYSWFNQQYVVEWFGCGCPVLDAEGNMVENHFNANDFTLLFWFGISVLATVLSVVLSKNMAKDRVWLRVLYVVGTLLISLLISYQFYQMMMWS